MKKRSIIVLFLIGLVLLSTGCAANPNTPIDPNGGIWDKYFVYPLSAAMDFFANLLFGNYGLAIIIVTILIRFLVLPLMITQIKSSKAMQELQPEIKKIREKYKDNSQKIQEETMKLFQKHNVNPLSGCLPILIQMPILIAFYHAIMRNAYIADESFLWLNLGEPDVLLKMGALVIPGVFPILAAFTTFLQTKMMGANAGATPQAAQQQKIMMIFMPLMILFIGATLPSALALYWTVGNVFTIIQTRFVKGIKIK